jgi:hypothetical protein
LTPSRATANSPRRAFDALADLSSNRDGQISALESDWQELKVWRALDQNGVAQSDELLRLEQLGITRIGPCGTCGRSIPRISRFSIRQ